MPFGIFTPIYFQQGSYKSQAGGLGQGAQGVAIPRLLAIRAYTPRALTKHNQAIRKKQN